MSPAVGMERALEETEAGELEGDSGFVLGEGVPQKMFCLISK